MKKLLFLFTAMLALGITKAQVVHYDFTKKRPLEVHLYSGGRIVNEIKVPVKSVLMVEESKNNAATLSLKRIKAGVYEITFSNDVPVDLILLENTTMRKTITVVKHKISLLPVPTIAECINDTLDTKTLTDKKTLTLNYTIPFDGPLHSDLQTYISKYVIMSAELSITVNGVAIILNSKGNTFELSPELLQKLKSAKQIGIFNIKYSHPESGTIRGSSTYIPVK